MLYCISCNCKREYWDEMLSFVITSHCTSKHTKLSVCKRESWDGMLSFVTNKVLRICTNENNLWHSRELSYRYSCFFNRKHFLSNMNIFIGLLGHLLHHQCSSDV